jgi:hypothetical protein
MTLSPKAVIKSLDENTSVPLKIVIPVMAAVVGGVVWLSSQMADMRVSIARVEESNARLEQKVDLAISARADR